MNISVIILAAGFGTRMKSKTPKVLQDISGFPMLYHIIKEANKISRDINVVLYHDYKIIKDEMKNYFDDVNFHIQDHVTYPGTGGAVMNVECKNEKILVLCGDMPLIQESNLREFLNHEEKIVMSVFKPKNIKGYGRVLIENENVKAIIEEKDASKEEKNIDTANAGVYLFDKEFLTKSLPYLKNDNAQKEYYITDLIALANKNNEAVKAIFVDAETFLGVNSKADLANVEYLMQKRIKENLMNDGVKMRLPDTIYIDLKAKFTGECMIENGVSIQGECLIENSHIKAHTIIEESEVINSDVGPLAHLRPKSVIKNTHIGNFVEVKKSNLNGVKAGHLSYLGDSEIDEGTNVGCGTITCNYDGKSKHKTKIGKNVFIGSDTQLVAPVTLEDNVIIAAGTTVTKDVSKGALGINRAPFKEVKGFYDKFFTEKKDDL